MNVFLRNNIFFILLLWLSSLTAVSAQTCDVDDDGDIDRIDVMQIFAVRNTPASGPDDPRDATGDGIINVIDGRVCSLQCTLPRCAIITPPPADVANIEVLPDTLNFGDVFVGDSANQSFSTGNTGTATLNVSSITSSGASFSLLSPSSFSITVGGAAQDVDIGFSPTAAGVFNGSITLNSNADNQDPVIVNVSGRGVEPVIDVANIDIAPALLNFGDVFVGSSSSQSLTVNNTGTSNLAVNGINSSGAPFTVFPPTVFDIAEAGTPRNVQIGFNPTVAGDFVGTITFNSNADNIDPVVINVSGRGIEPDPTAEPDIDSRDSMDFGSVAEGESVEQILTIQSIRGVGYKLTIKK